MNALTVSTRVGHVKNDSLFLTCSRHMFVCPTRPGRSNLSLAACPERGVIYHGDKCLPFSCSRHEEPLRMPDPSLSPLCPACKAGRLQAITRTEVFRPNGEPVTVELQASRCDACSVETTRAAQHGENLRRRAARKAHYGDLLMGEEIVALRKRYGLTQQAASRIFGKGKIAFSRYENEVTYPDVSTRLLLTMAIEKPDSLKWLADKAGVEIPLWRERSEDARTNDLKRAAAEPATRAIEAPKALPAAKRAVRANPVRPIHN